MAPGADGSPAAAAGAEGASETSAAEADSFAAAAGADRGTGAAAAAAAESATTAVPGTEVFQAAVQALGGAEPATSLGSSSAIPLAERTSSQRVAAAVQVPVDAGLASSAGVGLAAEPSVNAAPIALPTAVSGAGNPAASGDEDETELQALLSQLMLHQEPAPARCAVAAPLLVGQPLVVQPPVESEAASARRASRRASASTGRSSRRAAAAVTVSFLLCPLTKVRAALLQAPALYL